jgi:predicted transcriptional regulator
MTGGRKNRTKVDITYSILSNAKNGALKTHLMREANLNSIQITKMLETLVSNGLIYVANDKNYSLYQTAPTGEQFIASYEELLRLMGQSEGNARQIELGQKFVR